MDEIHSIFKYLKTSTGDDIVAEVLVETDKEVVLRGPIIVKTFFNPMNATTTVGFYPWVPIFELLSSEFTINKINIITIAALPMDVKSQYISYVKKIKEINEKKDEDRGKEEISSEPGKLVLVGTLKSSLELEETGDIGDDISDVIKEQILDAMLNIRSGDTANTINYTIH